MKDKSVLVAYLEDVLRVCLSVVIAVAILAATRPAQVAAPAPADAAALEALRREIRSEGAEAARAGKSIEECPRGALRKLWEEGWRAERRGQEPE